MKHIYIFYIPKKDSIIVYGTLKAAYTAALTHIKTHLDWMKDPSDYPEEVHNTINEELQHVEDALCEHQHTYFSTSRWNSLFIPFSVESHPVQKQ